MAPVNIAGQPILAAQELRRQGMDVTLMQYTLGRGHAFGYATDRTFDLKGRHRMEGQIEALRMTLAEGFDIYHFWMASFFGGARFKHMFGLDLAFLKARGRRIIYRSTGFDMRSPAIHRTMNPYNAFRYGYQVNFDEREQELWRAYVRDYADLLVVQDPEMQEYLPTARIIPRAIDLNLWPWVGVKPARTPLVVHAPSSESIKGTPILVDVVEELREEGLQFEFKLITRMAHEDAAKWYRQADIVVDQLHIGWYGVLTVEALALGKPVVVYIRDDLYDRFRPTIPVINANPDTLKEELRRIILDYDRRVELSNNARDFVSEVHDVRRVGAALREAYEDVMSREVKPVSEFADLEHFLHQYRELEAPGSRAGEKVRSHHGIHEEHAEPRRKAEALDDLRREIDELRAENRRLRSESAAEVAVKGRGRRPSVERVGRRRRTGWSRARERIVASLVVVRYHVRLRTRLRALLRAVRRAGPIVGWRRSGVGDAAPVSAAPVRSGALGDGDKPLRTFPYPYRAMLAISTDIDGTTMNVLRNTHRFLNTEHDTPWGRGLGLDIANSLWLFNDRRRRQEVAYFADYEDHNPRECGEELLQYVRYGWIDTLHTYGSFANAHRRGIPFERRYAAVALGLLEGNDLKLRVWVNHGSKANTQNIGPAAYMRGDNPAAAEYHADLLLQYGIRFMWDYRRADPDSSLFPRSPLIRMTLADGQRVWGFRRSTAVAVSAEEAESLRHRFPGARVFRRQTDGEWIAMVWHPQLLGWQLNRENLDAVVDAEAYAIFGQHLGVLELPRSRADASRGMFGDAALEAFRLLASYEANGRILVARTSRLLEYARVVENLEFDVIRGEEGERIQVHEISDPILGASVPTVEQLRGVSFRVADPARAEIWIGQTRIADDEILRVETHDESLACIRWHAKDRTDHTTAWLE